MVLDALCGVWQTIQISPVGFQEFTEKSCSEPVMAANNLEPATRLKNVRTTKVITIFLLILFPPFVVILAFCFFPIIRIYCECESLACL